MASPVDHSRSTTPEIDFFISYSPTDEAWAVWMAWELEHFGYTVMLQAWDFVAGSPFIEFMDRGVTRSGAVIAVLTDNYIRSRYGRMEWQAALRAAPDAPESKLITVRVEDCDPVGLLATITFLDLVGTTDREEARRLLLRRIQQAIEGRAKPAVEPGFPPHRPAGSAPSDAMTVAYPARSSPRSQRRLGRHPVPFPPVDLQERVCTILHIAGPRYDKRELLAGTGSQDAHTLAKALRARTGVRTPDAIVVSGDLTAGGSIREFDEARDFVVTLRKELRLPGHRLAIVPGPRDVNQAAAAAYFAHCEAEEIEPDPPFWPKWRHYERFFANVYAGVETARFAEAAPWSLFTIADLRIVIAGLNSTIAESHRNADHYGWIGAPQARWFADELSEFGGHWLRIGVAAHSPSQLRDHDRVIRILGDQLAVILHGPGDDIPTAPRAASTAPSTVHSALRPGQASLMTIAIGADGQAVSLESSLDLRPIRKGRLR